MSAFKAKPKFFDAMDDILSHPDCSAETHKFISNIVKTTRRTGFVSERQGVCCGGTYKAVVNKGVYVQHDWW